MRFLVRKIVREFKHPFASFEFCGDATEYAARKYVERHDSYDVVDSEDTATAGGKVVFTVKDAFEEEK